jgi:hypothetical protein
VIEAALRARIPYLDVAAEIEANLDTFQHYAERARGAGIGKRSGYLRNQRAPGG